MNRTIRQARVDLSTPAEVTLRKVMKQIEEMPPDTRLSNALMNVQTALDMVGAFQDEQLLKALK